MYKGAVVSVDTLPMPVSFIEYKRRPYLILIGHYPYSTHKKIGLVIADVIFYLTWFWVKDIIEVITMDTQRHYYWTSMVK